MAFPKWPADGLTIFWRGGQFKRSSCLPALCPMLPRDCPTAAESDGVNAGLWGRISAQRTDLPGSSWGDLVRDRGHAHDRGAGSL